MSNTDSQNNKNIHKHTGAPDLLPSDPLPSTAKTYSIVSLGCAKNQVDAERMIASLGQQGWTYVSEHDQASVVLVNTCAFIEDAREESLDTIFELRRLYPSKQIIVTGCMSQRYGPELASDLTEADGIFGNRLPEQISSYLGNRQAGRLYLPEQAADTGEQGTAVRRGGSERNPGLSPPIRRNRFLSHPGAVYVKVSEGCDNRCSFCAIPGIRGPLRSRGPEDILEESRLLLEQGMQEITLIGQDLGRYGYDIAGRSLLPELLEGFSSISGNFWIRVLYIHPDHVPEGLFSLYQKDPRLLPYFDLPVQHASARILRRMGRMGDSRVYLRLVEQIREALPDAVIRSTFLLGFPGEQEEDFKMLREFQEQALFDWAGSFVYSPEEGTPAAKLGGRPNRETASRRQEELQSRQEEISEARMDRFLGRELQILPEEPIPQENLSIGRAYLQAPEVDGLVVFGCRECRPGRFVRGTIVRRNGIDLEAELTGE